jgi:hypothetical protein
MAMQWAGYASSPFTLVTSFALVDIGRPTIHELHCDQHFLSPACPHNLASSIELVWAVHSAVQVTGVGIGGGVLATVG